MGYYLTLKRNGNTDVFYSMDECWKYYANGFLLWLSGNKPA